MTDRSRYGRICVAVLMVVAGAIIAGCGGSGSALLPDAGTTTAAVAGTVYAPAGSDTAMTTAQAGQSRAPVANCPVDVVRERDRAQLRTGRTDGRGRYRFVGLPAGETVMVQARLQSGARLMTRLQLRDGQCQADIDEDTTMGAVCSQLALGPVSAHTQMQRQLAGEVADTCLQYQAHNRYAYGQLNGQGPRFDDSEDVENAAGDLLAAVAGEALQQARRTRTEEACGHAVRMMLAHMQQVSGEEIPWSAQTMTRLAAALRDGENVPVERVANALCTMLGLEVDPATVQQVLMRLRQRLGAPEQDPPGLCEAVAAMCMADGTAAQLRLRTRERVQAFIDALVEPGSA